MKHIISILLFNFIISHTAFNFPFINTFTLDNGMKVIISPNFETPLVEVTFLANHGHLDNPIGGVGYGQDRASDLFGNSSGSLLYSDQNNDAFNDMGLMNPSFRFKNHQSLFNTFFYQQILAEDIELALKTTYNIFAHSEFKKDRSIFMQKFNIWRRPLRNFLESKLSSFLDNPYTLQELSEWHTLSMYYDVPINYKTVSIGKDRYKNLNHHQKAEKWTREKYSPHNMTLMVCGNINVDYTEKMIRDIFGNWESINFKEDNKKSSYIIRQNSPQYRYVHYTGNTLGNKKLDDKLYTTLSFLNKAPTYTDSDYYAHWLIRQMLFTRPISLLRHLFDESTCFT